MTLIIAADNLEPLKPVVAQALEALDPPAPPGVGPPPGAGRGQPDRY
jgi:hypothetical protein